MIAAQENHLPVRQRQRQEVRNHAFRVRAAIDVITQKDNLFADGPWLRIVPYLLDKALHKVTAAVNVAHRV